MFSIFMANMTIGPVKKFYESGTNLWFSQIRHRLGLINFSDSYLMILVPEHRTEIIVKKFQLNAGLLLLII